MRTGNFHMAAPSVAWLLAALCGSTAIAQDSSPDLVGPPAPVVEVNDYSIEIHPPLLENTLSVEGDIADIDAQRPGWLRADTRLQPWFAWKQRVQQRTGFTFGGSWGLLYQYYSSSARGEQEAVGSKFTLNMSYPLANRGKANALMFDMAVEDRRALFTDQPPLQAGLLAGSAIPTAATWGQFDLGITQAYIRQNLANNRFQYTIGKIFAPNFVDAYPFFDDNRQFLSMAFSTSPTIASPLRGFGFVGAAYPTSGNLYLKGGMFTAHSSDTGVTVDDFFSKGEHFYFFEAGLTRVGGTGMPIHARGPMDRDNIHITSWYRDALADGSPRAYGFNFNANSMAGDNLMWFVRGGWSEGWLSNLAFSGGFGYRPSNAPSDLFGVGLGWARASNSQLGSQYVGEIFYRFHITENFAITPDVQYISNPVLDPREDRMAVASVRARLTF